MGSLLVLPPDIRIQVFQNLLHDDRGIKLLYRIVRDAERALFVEELEQPSRLHPAILATCRQLYHEAGNVLYEGNRFIIEQWYRHSNSTMLTFREFPIQNFRCIANLAMSIGQGTRFRTMSPSVVVEILEWLSENHCKPKRLKMDFGFVSGIYFAYSWLSSRHHPTPFGYEHTTWNFIEWFVFPKTRFARDTSIARALADMSVSNEIKIQLRDDIDFAEVPFSRFVDSVASTKKWRVRTTQQHQGLGRVHPYHFRWSVRPAGGS